METLSKEEINEVVRRDLEEISAMLRVYFDPRLAEREEQRFINSNNNVMKKETKKIPAWLAKFLLTVASLFIGVLSEHLVENTEPRVAERELKLQLAKQATAESQLETALALKEIDDLNPIFVTPKV